MRIFVLASIFVLAASPILTGEAITLQQREDFSYEQRLAKLEAERAALKQEMEDAKTQILSLQESLKAVREKANSAADLSQENAEQIGIGRWLVSGILFVMGAFVTQLISRFMSSRRAPIKT